MDKKVKKSERKCTLIESIGILLVICFIFLSGSGLMGGEKVPMGMSMLLCATLVSFYCLYALHISWTDLWESVLQTYGKAIGALIILLEASFLSATWLASGATPTMIYYGMKLLDPHVFMLCAFLTCMFFSVLNGSCWATMSTFGLAFVGIAKALGVDYPLAVAAIVCGSFIGNKWSPMADAANFAASMTGTNVFQLFVHLFPTNGVAVLISAVLFLFLGLSGEADLSTLNFITSQLEANFSLSLLTLLPVLFVVIMSLIRKPIIPTLQVSALMAVVFGMVFEGESLSSMMNYMWSGYAPDFGDPSFNELVSGGGLLNTANATMVVFCALVLAGILNRSGIMPPIANALGKIAKTRPALVTASLIVSILGTFMGGTAYTGTIMITSMFSDMYEEAGLSKLDLARTACAGGLTSFIVPWSGDHMIILTNSGLVWSDYIQYAYTLWIVYFMVIVVSFFPPKKHKLTKELSAA